jgi:hypothetical protein
MIANGFSYAGGVFALVLQTKCLAKYLFAIISSWQHTVTLIPSTAAATLYKIFNIGKTILRCRSRSRGRSCIIAVTCK